MSEDARRQRAAAIFQSLLEQPRGERDAALVVACGGDGALGLDADDLAAIIDETLSTYEGNLIETGLTDKVFNNPDEKMTANYVAGQFG